MASSADSAVLDRVSAGSLTYEHGVYGAIAYRAVRAVRGVIDTSRSVVSGMLGRFGGNKYGNCAARCKNRSRPPCTK